VVALLGFRRFRAGRPVGTVRFTRRPGAGGEVTIPAGTPVTDAAGTMRYETAETRTMLAGESTAEVAVRGANPATAVAEPGTLTSVQRAIAGIDRVSNERPTSPAGADETDVELRARVRVALVGAAKGTLPALVNGLLALPSVRAVNIVERPDDVPGELAISVSLRTPAAQMPAEVIDRIEELRPAGIRVRVEQAADLALTARVALVFAGGSLPAAERERLRTAARDTLVDLVGRTQVGQRVRTGALQAALIDGERVVDARVALRPVDPSLPDPGTDVRPAPGQAVRLAAQDVTFDADVFDAPATATTAARSVEVHAQVRPGAPGSDPQALASGVTTRLTGYLAGLTPGTTVTAQALLTALRDDTAYALDPLGLIVTFRSGDTFVQVAEGGETFTTTAGQTFTVTGVDVV
jgi:hypothetical protein